MDLVNPSNDQVLKLWKSCYDEDEDDIDEFTEEELANDPSKRILWAAENNKLEVVSELLSTTVQGASCNNHKDMVHLLLSHGENISAKTADGGSHYTAQADGTVWKQPKFLFMLVPT
ncbi:ankyrin repeat domain-containing protein 49-like [Physella acuta]|uniref:ankyrin repeat domain-containing protein 49-like n=1 Tax=Physella acuta TaxID=109671 RepID=UPI0027DBBEB4|nr:ankyrin repeat domain-containing protein 49-like [Physella acuta]